MKFWLCNPCGHFNTFSFYLFRRTRSFFCGIATGNHYLVASIVTKTYYNIEIWLSLPCAILFYTIINVVVYVLHEIQWKEPKFLSFIHLSDKHWIAIFSFSLIIMYSILPETEQWLPEDIELHFSDNSMWFTDIHIQKMSKSTTKL